jgi:hypothetical protein
MVPIEIEDACSSRRPVGRSERVQVVLIGHPRQTSEYVTHIGERIFAVTLTVLMTDVLAYETQNYFGPRR